MKSRRKVKIGVSVILVLALALTVNATVWTRDDFRRQEEKCQLFSESYTALNDSLHNAAVPGATFLGGVALLEAHDRLVVCEGTLERAKNRWWRPWWN